MVKIKNFVEFLALATGVILIWRGVWEIADMYLTFNHPVLTAIVSLLLGGSILFFTDRRLNELV